MQPEIHEMSAAAIAADLARGTLTAMEVAQAFLERCAAHDGLHAFLALDPARVLAEAAARDRARGAAAALGPLHGLPLAIKDNIDVAGYPTTCNTPLLGAEAAPRDAEIVARLRAAGAIVLGKTNMPELGLGQPNDPASGGDAVHPLATDHLTGGSSSGSAVALAAGLAPAALGTDTGGSIRIPAALCGVAGLRPTVGRWPRAGRAVLSPTCDTAGPMARDVADLALLDAVVTGDWAAPELKPRDVRLGVSRRHFFDDLDREVERAIDAALAALRGAGMDVVEVELPEIDGLSTAAGLPISLHEALTSLDRLARDHGLDFAGLLAALASPATRDMLGAIVGDAGPSASETPYRAAIERHRPALQRTLAGCFRDDGIAALVFPTTPLPARPLAQWQRVRHNGRDLASFEIYLRNTTSGAAAGLPGLTIPAGRTSAGLPVGLALDGAPFADRRLLAVGSACQAALLA